MERFTKPSEIITRSVKKSIVGSRSLHRSEKSGAKLPATVDVMINMTAKVQKKL